MSIPGLTYLLSLVVPDHFILYLPLSTACVVYKDCLSLKEDILHLIQLTFESSLSTVARLTRSTRRTPNPLGTELLIDRSLAGP